jgi:hypothetical protein
MMLLCMEFPLELGVLPDGVIGELSPVGTPSSAEDVERLSFTQAQARAIVGFLRFFELRDKLEWSEPDWPDEAILSVPTERPLERAIKVWTARASDDVA